MPNTGQPNPASLFQYVLSLVKNKDTAWDCATGNGQTPLPLTAHFTKVIATDISAQQLQQAPLKTGQIIKQK